MTSIKHQVKTILVCLSMFDGWRFCTIQIVTMRICSLLCEILLSDISTMPIGGDGLPEITEYKCRSGNHLTYCLQEKKASAAPSDRFFQSQRQDFVH